MNFKTDIIVLLIVIINVLFGRICLTRIVQSIYETFFGFLLKTNVGNF